MKDTQVDVLAGQFVEVLGAMSAAQVVRFAQEACRVASTSVEKSAVVELSHALPAVARKALKDVKSRKQVVEPKGIDSREEFGKV